MYGPISSRSPPLKQLSIIFGGALPFSTFSFSSFYVSIMIRVEHKLRLVRQSQAMCRKT